MMSRDHLRRIRDLEHRRAATPRRLVDVTKLSPSERAELADLGATAKRVGMAALTDADVDRGAELQSKALGIPYAT